MYRLRDIDQVLSGPLASATEHLLDGCRHSRIVLVRLDRSTCAGRCGTTSASPRRDSPRPVIHIPEIGDPHLQKTGDHITETRNRMRDPTPVGRRTGPTKQPSRPTIAKRPAFAVSAAPAIFARRRTAGTPVCEASPTKGRTCRLRVPLVCSRRPGCTCRRALDAAQRRAATQTAACSRRPTSTTSASLNVIATDDWILWGRGIGGHPHTGISANRPPRRSPETSTATPCRETVGQSVCPSSKLRGSLLDGLEIALGSDPKANGGGTAGADLSVGLHGPTSRRPPSCTLERESLRGASRGRCQEEGQGHAENAVRTPRFDVQRLAG